MSDSSTTRVLIADSSRQIREFLRDAVAGHGDDVDIIEAVNGGETLDVLSAREVELAFVDIDLPGLAGGDAVNRAQFFSKKSFLIMLSADRKRAADHDDLANLMIIKPFHRNAVMTAIRNWKIWRQTYTVLLAAPDASLREEMKEELRKLDLKLIMREEVDGAEALMSCRQNHVDIVIADYGLPTMGAEELLQVVRRQRLPVKVILSGPDGAAKSIQRAKKLRADGYVYPGIELTELSRTLLRTLGIRMIEDLRVTG